MEKLLELYEARLRNICGKLGGIVRVESKQAQQYFYDLCVRKECFQLIIEDIKEMKTESENMAIKFAEWMEKMCWYRNENGLWIDPLKVDETEYTIDQLFNKFKNEIIF